MFTFWFLNGIQVAKEGGAKWKSMTDKVSFIWFLYVFLLNISEIVERIIVWLFILFSRIMAMDNPISIRRPRILNWKITHTPNYKKLEAIFCRDFVGAYWGGAGLCYQYCMVGQRTMFHSTEMCK